MIGVKSVLETLHEITLHGRRQECSRQALLTVTDCQALYFNINRMLKDGLLMKVERGGAISHRVEDRIFHSVYRNKTPGNKFLI